MPRSLNVRRSIALSTLVVTAWGTTALPAAAGTGGSDDTATDTQTHGHAKDTETVKGKHTGQAKGHGGTTDDGTTDDGTTDDGTTDDGTTDDGTTDDGTTDDGTTDDDATDEPSDPAGNNGTVKIAPLGEMDAIPNNTPHPGCDFEVEWYGYDEGADIVSTVTFAMQAPTRDAALTVSGPESVFVGGDAASGAGTETGLDGRETYALSFDGEPQAQQGYHVKLTVATPRSNGNDTKTKVFWVEPCDTATATGTATSAPGAGGAPDSGGQEVLGIQASAAPEQTEVAPARAGESGVVPTVIDAGERAAAAMTDFARAPWPLAAAGLGAALLFGAGVTRRRRGVDVQK